MGCGRWRTCGRLGADEPRSSLVVTPQRRKSALPPDVRGLRKTGVSPAMLQPDSGPQRRSAIRLFEGRLASAGLPFRALHCFMLLGWVFR